MKKILLILALLLLSFSIFSQTNLRRGSGADLPAGMVVAFAGQNCPNGLKGTNI